MKKILFVYLLTLIGTICYGQIVFENFDNIPDKGVPTNWTVSSNTSVTTYNRPFSCTSTDKGLLTPGVGKNAPSRMILPITSFDATNKIIKVTFTIWVFDANLTCTSMKDFECPTFVTAYLVKTVVSDGLFKYSTGNKEQKTNELPPSNEVYTQISHRLVQANTANTLIIDGSNIPDGANYRVYLDFKTAENTQCSASGTKFIFDDIKVTKNHCANCPPVARSDYFRFQESGFTDKINANVFGTNLAWIGLIPSNFQNRSLLTSPAVEGGFDEDLNLPNLLTDLEFRRVQNSLTITNGCNSTSLELKEFTFNNDGTFTIDRGLNTCISRVTFKYYIYNNKTNLTSGEATVIVDFELLNVLPVHFQSFSATRNPQKKEQVLLKWQTASEQNNRGFNVQRKIDGQWKNIAFVFSQAENGNSNSTLTYEYKDANVSNTVTQYQIQQVDFDGKTSYSDIKSVIGLEQKSSVLIYPNPAVDGKIKLLFIEQGGLKDVIVSDVNGRPVKQFLQLADLNLTIEGLKSGFYTIKIIDRTTAKTTVEKVIIK